VRVVASLLPKQQTLPMKAGEAITVTWLPPQDFLPHIRPENKAGGRLSVRNLILKPATSWTAPAMQEESDVSARRSGAAMYPAFECSRYGRRP
jgi:hypothetical protein